MHLLSREINKWLYFIKLSDLTKFVSFKLGMFVFAIKSQTLKFLIGNFFINKQTKNILRIRSKKYFVTSSFSAIQSYQFSGNYFLWMKVITQFMIQWSRKVNSCLKNITFVVECVLFSVSTFFSYFDVSQRCFLYRMINFLFVCAICSIRLLHTFF